MKRRTNKTQSRTQKLDRQQLGNVAGGGIMLTSSMTYTSTSYFNDGGVNRDK